MDKLAVEVYSMLTAKQKKHLEEKYCIDCAYDMANIISEEYEIKIY